MCPFKSLEKYMAVLNQGYEVFFQRPKVRISITDSTWFEKAPLGKNTFGNKMKELSAYARLSKTYTNHSLRATTITLLDKNGFEARHIMSISGHKSENSIRCYSKTDGAKKQDMSKVLSHVITTNTGDVPCQDDAQQMEVEVNASVSSSSTITALVNEEDKKNTIRSPAAYLSTTEEKVLDAPVQPQDNRHNIPDLADMVFMELAASQEKVFMESLEVYSKCDKLDQNNSSIMKSSTSTVEKKSFSGKHPMINFHHVGQVHIHYH